MSGSESADLDDDNEEVGELCYYVNHCFEV